MRSEGLDLRCWPLLLLLAGCATSPPRPGQQPIEVRVPDPPVARGEWVDTWSLPLAHHPRLQSAEVGQVVVEAIWTVHFRFTPDDAAWLADLERQHGQLRLTWNGYQLAGGSVGGYVMGLGSRQKAESALPQLPVLEPAAAR